MSVHVVQHPSGAKAYVVRWREGSRNRSRSFTGRGAKRDADAFDAHVRRLRQARGAEDIIVHDKTLSAAVADWWDGYAEPNLTQRTRDVYATQLDLRILPTLGDLRLRQITPAIVEGFLADLTRKGTPAPTVIKTATVLQAVLKRAVVNGWIDANPVAAVRKPPQRVTREPAILEPEHVEQLRGVLGPRDATLVSVLAYAGLRPESEALALRWADVGDRSLRVRATKTGRDRHVRLLDALAADLAAWKPQTSRTLIFDHNGAWTRSDWRNWTKRRFRPALEAIGLPLSIRPRDLRASYASLLIAEGANLIEVAEQMGNSPTMTLKHYGRVLAEYDPAKRTSANERVRKARQG